MKTGLLVLLFIVAFSVSAKDVIKPSVSGLYQVDKVNLFIECYGEASPSIIINAGFGGKVEDGNWKKVIQSLHKKNRVCIYDRANLGKSDKSQGHYDLGTIVEHQNVLLQRAGIQPPYVMVGHSYGSYPIKLFNHLYPEKVSAILLVDPSLYGQFRSHIKKWDAKNDTYDADTKKNMEAELASWHGAPDNLEKINMRTSSTFIQQSDDFGDTPYVLLWNRDAIWVPANQTPDNWHPAVWERIKKSYSTELNKMQTLSKDTKITFATTPEHYIQKHEPEIVIAEINYLLNKL